MSFDQETAGNLFNHVMEIWVNPEIERRKRENAIPKDYEIDRIQVIVKPNDVPSVRFNEEVKIIAIARFKPGVKKNIIGEPVHYDEIKQIIKLEMTEDDDPNYGHLTMVLFQKGWMIGFDFRTNKKLAHDRYTVGIDFLRAAEILLEKYLLRPFVDVLFSAVELFVTAQLFVMAEQKYIVKPRHPSTSLKYNQFINLGNYKSDFKELFNKLNGLRDKARYLKGEPNLSVETAKIMLQTAQELSDYTKKRIS
jgi:hypothetical protein